MIENSYFAASAVFLIKTVFGVASGIVLLRLLLQWIRADFRNPFSQFVLTLTNPVIVPLRRLIPGIGGYDVATIVVLLALLVLEVLLLQLAVGRQTGLLAVIALTGANLVDLILTLFTFSILLGAILSFFGPRTDNPIGYLLTQLNGPLLRPIQRVLPKVNAGGMQLDLSPLVALVILQLLKLLILAPLLDWAHRLS